MANHSSVAHAWANKTGKSSKGFNVYYEGDTIYSYGRHFPVARHITLPDNTPAILFTTRTYSPSTGQHISEIRQACSHIRTIHVDLPTAEPSVSDVDALLASAETLMARARRARTNGPFLIEQAATAIERANELITVFGLARTITSVDRLAPDLAEIRRKAAEAAAALQAKRVADQAEARIDWQAGISHRFYGTDEHGNAYVRVIGDHLETSQGASVPLEHAKRVFQLIISCRAQSKTWTPSGLGRRMQVGDFTVSSIAADGSMIAGCHTFAWPEIARVAQSIGMLIPA